MYNNKIVPKDIFARYVSMNVERPLKIRLHFSLRRIGQEKQKVFLDGYGLEKYFRVLLSDVYIYSFRKGMFEKRSSQLLCGGNA